MTRRITLADGRTIEVQARKLVCTESGVLLLFQGDVKEPTFVWGPDAWISCHDAAAAAILEKSPRELRP